MSTTIRITDDDRKRLDRIQRRLTDLTGNRFTLQRLVGLMAEHAEAKPDHLVETGWTPPGKDFLDTILAEARAHGGWEGSATDIDEELYGNG